MKICSYGITIGKYLSNTEPAKQNFLFQFFFISLGRKITDCSLDGKRNPLPKTSKT